MEDFYTSFPKAPKMKFISVYEQLRMDLLAGKWDFGEKISVNELIDRFKVSRRPIMDALKMLEGNGFIEIIPQSGCKVIDYSKKNIIDQLLLSSAIESLAAELAAIHHQREEIEKLENYHLQIKNKPEELRSKIEYHKYSRNFHYSVQMMTHSEIIIKNTMQIWALTDFYLLNSFDYFMFDPSESIEGRNKILTCIKNRNATEAKKSMEEYTLNFIETLRNRLP
ncbi:GntR family transcriptional regulator [Neobacillus bataviensis LMG 21833]|uniref:GntR family transcriptional regulator n=1 Tax=Neobacillus bataviensis LMG 21833 TaxID=1117379 RepID=K6DC68_9BACI|nr:GntR family transcriptional regulator [Neobacillus bataviensis]EKN65899.1 GntR family transcriptional regulator [Neobacillus bataviensis LMG 21833]